MENKSKQPEYPCFDISNDDSDVFVFSPITDDLIYAMDQEVIDQYYLNHLLVDCKGDVYKIVGVEKLAWWRKFIPSVPKARIITQYTGKEVTLEVLRAHMLNRYDSLDWTNSGVIEVYEFFREKLVKAQNFRELMS